MNTDSAYNCSCSKQQLSKFRSDSFCNPMTLSASSIIIVNSPVLLWFFLLPVYSRWCQGRGEAPLLFLCDQLDAASLLLGFCQWGLGHVLFTEVSVNTTHKSKKKINEATTSIKEYIIYCMYLSTFRALTFDQFLFHLFLNMWRRHQNISSHTHIIQENKNSWSKP